MVDAEHYEDPGPTRDEVDGTTGITVLEFGADWCGYCQAARPFITAVVDDVSGVCHRKVADGPGRPLGRSYRVKLWPTLIFLKDGAEVARVVRPQSEDDVRRGLSAARVDRADD